MWLYIIYSLSILARMLPHFIVTRPLSPVMVFGGVLLSFTTKCNPFFLSGPAQLCEGPVFPTDVALCNGTSLVTLTACSPRCTKHNLGTNSAELSLGLAFMTQHFLFSYGIKSHLSRLPPLARRYTIHRCEFVVTNTGPSHS